MDDLFRTAWVITVIVCLILLGVSSSDLQDIKKLTGHSLHSMQQLKGTCEASLPRDKECVLTIIAKEGK